VKIDPRQATTKGCINVLVHAITGQPETKHMPARFVNGALESSLFIGPDINLPARDWIEHMFARDTISAVERSCLLSGRAPAGGEDVGRIICACNQVGESRILEVIREQGQDTVEKIVTACGAGSNCGSCIPNIKGLLAGCAEPVSREPRHCYFFRELAL
jgi:assimilatory nitrate reductase catalytic subunit